MTNVFERFERDFLQANTWDQRKDGAPLYLLDRMSPEERAQAEDRLIGSLSEGDSWPALGLGHLGSSRALPDLYALLSKCTQGMVIFVAFSIYQINRDARMIEAVLAELPKITNEYILIDTLYYLGIFDDPRIKAALKQYRKDPRYLVAYNAARTLGESTDEVVQEFRKKKSG
jgi:hypothetical protein